MDTRLALNIQGNNSAHAMDRWAVSEVLARWLFNHRDNASSSISRARSSQSPLRLNGGAPSGDEDLAEVDDLPLPDPIDLVPPSPGTPPAPPWSNLAVHLEVQGLSMHDIASLDLQTIVCSKPDAPLIIAQPFLR